MEKQKILFLCTGNSCRSQMAEGLCRQLHNERIEAYSAGIERHGLNPNAMKVMTEAGIDISRHISQTIEDLTVKNFNLVITLCGHADEHCPVFPGNAQLVHKGFDDPPALARAAKSEEEALQYYRRVRDEIREYIKELPTL